MKGVLTSMAISCFALPAIAENFQPNKTYEPGAISGYIEDNNLQPYAQSTIEMKSPTGRPMYGGKMFVLHSAETEEWAIFQQARNGNIKYLNSGSMSSDFSERHNAISVDYLPSEGICDNIAPDFSHDNDLLFSGLSDDNDRIIMIFGQRAHNSDMHQDTSMGGILVSQNQETGHCMTLKRISGLSFMHEQAPYCGFGAHWSVNLRTSLVGDLLAHKIIGDQTTIHADCFDVTFHGIYQITRLKRLCL